MKKLAIFLVFLFIFTVVYSDDDIINFNDDMPRLPEIDFSGKAEAGKKVSARKLPKGGVENIETASAYDSGIYIPPGRTRGAVSDPVIRKQDVYGRELTDDFYFYRSLLNDDEQAAYDQILQNVLKLNRNSFYLEGCVSQNRITHITTAVLYDHPDIFWFSGGVSYTYGDDKNIKYLTLKYYECSKNLDFYKEKLYACADSVLEQVMVLETDIEKIKYIHDLLTYANTYMLKSQLNQTIYSSIVNLKTVCTGYSKAFAYYMQRLGIPCTVLYGNARGGLHAWNLVKIDDEYYEMDVTWNDPVSNPPNKYYYTYFNITTGVISKSHKRDKTLSEFPLAEGTVYSYPNFFGNKPGSDFGNLKYGHPQTELPFVYIEK